MPANLKMFYHTTPITAWSEAPTFGPEVSFATHYCQDHPDVDLVLIKCALGGTSLNIDWNPNIPGNFYARALQDVRDVMTSLHLTGPVDFMLWGQGERDVLDLSDSLNYQANLIHFVKRLRDDLASPQLAFVYFLVQRADGYWQLIQQGQRRAVAELGRSAYVETNGLPKIEPVIRVHYTCASLIEIGNRMYLSYLWLGVPK